VRSPGESPTQADIACVSEQLGRPARDIAGISARCVCGKPIVVVTLPRLETGTPFPTLYYLSQPAATKAASRLEAEGKMAEYQDRLGQDDEARHGYQRAHEDFLTEREALGHVEEIVGDFSRWYAHAGQVPPHTDGTLVVGGTRGEPGGGLGAC